MARRLLELLPESGSAANRASLVKRLGGEAALTRAQEELIEEGQIELVGHRLRRRTQVTPSANKPIASPLSKYANSILQELPYDGSYIGSLRLRAAVDMSNDAFQAAVAELKQRGVVRVGPGRGGTVALSRPAEPRTVGTGRQAVSRKGVSLVTKEDELYVPFRDWLQSTLTANPFAHARVTASPEGRKQSSGQWSRPDVTAIAVWQSEWLPRAEVLVSSYEVKRFRDAHKLESVYEAKAHGRWAHQANLVVEVPEPADKLAR